jgi:ribonuclease HII
VTVAEIREELTKAAPQGLPSLIRRYASDDRAGVRSAVETARRRLDRHKREQARLDSLVEHQSALHEEGFAIVAGIDEVGRGALAGPVSAAAVVLPLDARIEALDDSKRLDAEVRTTLAVRIREVAEDYAVAHIDAATIDLIGIAPATVRAMREALAGLESSPDHALIDGLPVDIGCPSTAVVDGDAKVSAIAAASIVAKVERDALMADLDGAYPGYDLERNKGYGTDEHRRALAERGVSPIHRRSFTPCGGTVPLF